MSEKKDYFDFIENVLGVKSIFLNQTTANENIKTPLLICVENFEDYNFDEKDLLAKMIGALKIDLQLIKVSSQIESDKYISDFTIYFVNNLGAKNLMQTNIVTTYSPRFLLKNANFKKNVWNDLQKVIVYFRQNTVSN